MPTLPLTPIRFIDFKISRKLRLENAQNVQNAHKNLSVAACHRIPLRSYVPFIYCSTRFPHKNVDAQTMIAIRFYRPNDCKSCCKYGWKMHKKCTKIIENLSIVWKKNNRFSHGRMPLVLAPPPTHTHHPSPPPTLSRASRLRHWLLNLRCIGNGYDYASVSYASVFLTQVYLNFRAISPCKPKISTYTTTTLWRLHSSRFVYYFKQVDLIFTLRQVLVNLRHYNL